ncbi:protein S40-7-like [Lycium ferocissimum]|uniref:protein S40-7-like n=1 Tax=Lycium ferocissimum TaxID=112874 RepID=UPI002814FD34|nr:protein S40-7-like [Lycium ferocissimum]
MDSGNGAAANNSRYHRKPPYSDRLLRIFSTAQPSTTAGDELSEHDIFDALSDSNIPSTSTSPNANHHRSHPRHFGILAALPESHAPGLLSVSSSSTSSAARLIPTIPKRPPVVDRVKYLQSAPVNVPVKSTARRGRHFDDDDDEVEGGDHEMLVPPHEFVASRQQTPVLACSVFEGVGRKLKGRDLRQVRNTIWNKTGVSIS